MSAKIECSHKEPVAAGTIVRCVVPDSAAHVDETFEWTVRGPRSSDLQVFRSGVRFDWDTTGRTPGAYDVNARSVSAGEHDEPADGGEPAPTPSKDEGEGELGARLLRAAVAPGTREWDQQTEQAEIDDGDYLPWQVHVVAAAAGASEGVLPVSLQRTSLVPTADQVLWVVIRNRTNAISFRRYKEFIDKVMGQGRLDGEPESARVQHYRGPHAYELLRRATDAFLMQETGVVRPAGSLDAVAAIDDIEHQMGGSAGYRIRSEERRRLGRDVTPDDLEHMRESFYEALGQEDPGMLPYLRGIRSRLSEVPLKSPQELPGGAYGILPSSLAGPLAMELIWSYWHEEGMLVQTLNSILARFQNRRSPGRDPLARFDLDPLRPLSNLFWGWVQDEMKRLTVRRRSFEYEHEYGLRLIGRAVPDQPAADRRSKFLEALHGLLHLSHVFFKEDDDTTVLADGFPVLNALRETHLVLAEGAHNQFGDLPSTARAEMLVMQWLLARPEMREFLGGRVMVPYEEPWMDRVDSMKQMQGWGDTSVTHFRDMGVYGEQILLSVRYGDWSTVNDPQQAANWARYWRPEIQRYTHAYRSATGVDLTDRVDATTPGYLLKRRLVAQAGTQR